MFLLYKYILPSLAGRGKGMGLLLLCLLCGKAQAQHLSPTLAKQRIAEPQLRLVYESDALYAFDSPRGFYLSATDATQPAILGYSDEGSFEQAKRNPTFSLLVSLMERNLRVRRNTNTIVPHVRPSGVKDEVPPMLPSLFHQYKPFNDSCPIVDGDTCVTGCVANAMAEVMNYHQWPIQGKGSYTYFDSLGCKQTLTADFASHRYDWSNICNDYEAGYTPKQAAAVATLLSDCGISLNMRYGVETSATSMVYQPIALTRYFGYDEGMQIYFRNFFTQIEWDSLMFTELSEGRPLMAGGWSPDSGHSFTVDGYDHNGLFHCCFGNPQGNGNAWLNYTFLSPDQPLWHDPLSPETGMNLLQTLLVGVKPKRTSEPSPQTHIYGFSHIAYLGSQSDGTHRIAVYNLGNIGWNEHTGRVGILLMENSKYKSQHAEIDASDLLYTYDHPFPLEEITDSTFSDTLTIRLPQHLPNGLYRIVPVFEEPDGHFVEARTMVGTPNYLQCSVNDASVSISTPQHDTAKIRITDIQFPDTIEYLQKPQYSFTIHNDGAEYSGRIFITLAPHKITTNYSSLHLLLCQEGLSIGAGASLQRDFSRSFLNRVGPGNYQLRIYADIDLFTDSVRIIYDDPDHVITVVPRNYHTAIQQQENSGNEQPDEVFDLSGHKTPFLPSHRRGVSILKRGSRTIKVRQ